MFLSEREPRELLKFYKNPVYPSSTPSVKVHPEIPSKCSALKNNATFGNNLHLDLLLRHLFTCWQDAKE